MSLSNAAAADSIIRLKYLYLSTTNEESKVVEAISEQALSLSTVLQSEFDTSCSTNRSSAPSPPLVLQVSLVTLKHLIQYLNQHRGVAPPPILRPIRSCKMDLICPVKFDAEFINQVMWTGLPNLYQLTDLSWRLKIDCLLDLCCAKIATLIKNQPRNQLRRILQP